MPFDSGRRAAYAQDERGEPLRGLRSEWAEGSWLLPGKPFALSVGRAAA